MRFEKFVACTYALFPDFDYCQQCFLDPPERRNKEAFGGHQRSHRFLCVTNDDEHGNLPFVISSLRSKDPCLLKILLYCLTSELAKADELVQDFVKYQGLYAERVDEDDVATQQIIEDTRSRLTLALPEAADYAEAMAALASRLREYKATQYASLCLKTIIMNSTLR